MDLLRELFDQQRLLLDHFFQTIDLGEMQSVLEISSTCSGTIVFTGVGKSGLIAEKIAATFVSAGIRSLFLHPSDALHGGLGMLGAGDVLVAMSKSGRSQELLDLLPYVVSRGVKTVAVVSALESPLEQACSQTVHLPVLREVCPLDLVPTTSSTIQLIFGDILALALMKSRGFSAVHFASNHPGGTLGKKSALRASDLMHHGEAIPKCRPKDKLVDVLCELSAKQCGCLVVMDDRRELLGIFTDGDLRRAMQASGAAAFESTIGELMTHSPKSIKVSQMATDAMHIMETGRPVTVLPVLEDKKVVGVIRMHDIVKAGLR